MIAVAERAYPITLGSNLGTTTTSLIAAFSLEMEPTAFRLALCHAFFNLIGILLFFLVPKLRWPLFMARKAGDKAVKYKWFSIFYLIASFFLLPLGFYGQQRRFISVKLMIPRLEGMVTQCINTQLLYIKSVHVPCSSVI